MQCMQCHTDNLEGAKFCFECGARLQLICEQCRTTLPPSAKFCLECGATMTAPAADAPADPYGLLPERIRKLVPAKYADRLLRAGEQVSG
ncbi:MAG: zinc ribbon domain-containing protein [Anaerolineae bacterium]